jgi:hypothetical protein
MALVVNSKNKLSCEESARIPEDGKIQEIVKRARPQLNVPFQK